VVLAVTYPWASASSYLSSQSVADSRCNPHATPRSSYSRRSPSCRFFLCRPALLCLVLQRHRRLSVPCSRGFSCLSAQFRSPRCVLWPLKFIQLTSRENDSSDAHSYHLPTRHVGTGVPFGYVVTADDGITTGVKAAEPKSLCVTHFLLASKNLLEHLECSQ